MVGVYKDNIIIFTLNGYQLFYTQRELANLVTYFFGLLKVLLKNTKLFSRLAKRENVCSSLKNYVSIPHSSLSISFSIYTISFYKLFPSVELYDFA